jgi:dTMP kinase
VTTKGGFITFEGGDGTGKSTQVKLLDSALTAAGLDVVTTREPGGTPQAEKIRNLLLQRDSGNFDGLSEAMMMMAARREHLVNKIWPAIEQGKWVVSDRFADSTRAFQGYGQGLDMQKIENLYALIAGDFQPDLTLIFDIEPEVGLQRSMKHMATTENKTEATEDRFERMGISFHNRLRQGFLDIAKNFPERCVLIDASQSIDAVHSQILQVVSDRLSLSLKGAKHG